MSNYFESLKGDYRHDYLTETPKKADVIANAKKDGVVTFLPDSNNRAVVIVNDVATYLQSYDTLILKVTRNADGVTITKLWDGYSKTTIKHINEFMKTYTGAVNTFNKKEWEAFDTMTI